MKEIPLCPCCAVPMAAVPGWVTSAPAPRKILWPPPAGLVTWEARLCVAPRFPQTCGTSLGRRQEIA